MGWEVYDPNNIISNGRSLESGEPGRGPDGFGNICVLPRMKPRLLEKESDQPKIFCSSKQILPKIKLKNFSPEMTPKEIREGMLLE